MDRNDIIPSLHLSNLQGNLNPVLAFVSDSTGLPGGAAGSCNQLSASQCLWGALKDGFRRQNPTSLFNFDLISSDDGNYAIGGAGWQHVLKTGEETKLKLPGWFTVRSKKWLDYVQAREPDVLLFNLGINYAYHGYHPYGGQNVIYHLAQVLAEIAKWKKTPNIIFVTNKAVNSQIIDGSGSFKPGPSPAYFGVAAALRSVARSSGALLNQNFPDKMKHFGLIDIGRYFGTQVLGKDHVNQYLARVPADALENHVLTTSPEPVTLGHTAHGDFSFTILLPNQGGGTIFENGVRRIQLQFGHWKGQVLTLQFHNNSGAFCAKYTPVHFTSTHTLVGPNMKLPPGDLSISVECRQERLTISVNGQSYLAASVPRLICEGPILIWSMEAPTSPAEFRIISFYQGRALSSRPAMTEDMFFGAYGSTTVKSDGAFGGNGVNHPASTGVTLVDYPAVCATNLAAAF